MYNGSGRPFDMFLQFRILATNYAVNNFFGDYAETTMQIMLG